MLEAAVMLSHSWVEDMDECHEALNSYCESADWKREKYHATGTCDFLQRNRWYCVDCGLNALDMYEDKELAEAIRFLRSHACKSQHEVYSHNSFLGFGDPTCYNGRYCFSAEDVQLVQKYSKIVEFFYQRKL